MNGNETPKSPPSAGGRASGRRDIHVWQVPLDVSSEVSVRLGEWLTPAEREQAGRFHFPRDQRRFVVRRAVLRQLLANSLGVHPHLIRLAAGRNGKPTIADATNSAPLKFNCSHSGDWALIAISRDIELGVDVEQQRDLPDAGDLAKNYFSDREIWELVALPSALRRKAFFTCWTRKEAFLKAIGLGLSFPLNRFSVSLAPDQPAALLEVDGDPEAASKWSVVALDVGLGYSAALVHEAGAVSIVRHDWHPERND